MSFKNIAASFLILVLLAHSFKTVTVIANFSLHQDEIAKTLCEQKDVIGQTCNGKCQLVIALKTDLKQNQTPLEQIKIRFISSNYLQPVNKIIVQNSYKLIAKSDFAISIDPIIRMNYTIIIPPPKQA